jgi:hypothetical protein
MKFSNIGKIALLLGCVSFAACEEDSDYGPYSVGDKDFNEGVSFDYSSTTYTEDLSEIEEPAKEVTIHLVRKDASATTVVPIEVVSNDSVDGVALFNIPETVTFEEGLWQATFKVTFPQAGGGSHTFTVQIPEAYRNTYANNMLQYTVTLPYSWISYSGTFYEYFMDVDNVPVTIQNVEGSNRWRVVKPYASFFQEGEEYDSSYASYINFVVNEDGTVTFTTYRVGLYSDGSQIYGFYPSSLSASLKEDDAYSVVYNPQQVVLYPYYYIPGVGGWGDDYPVVITLNEGSFGDFYAEEEGE